MQLANQGELTLAILCLLCSQSDKLVPYFLCNSATRSSLALPKHDACLFVTDNLAILLLCIMGLFAWNGPVQAESHSHGPPDLTFSVY
jgi:hypothetical protein